MFPTPIQKRSRAAQLSYQTLLPLALIMWLLPLIAVMLFSIRPLADFSNGNYWGIPSSSTDTAACRCQKTRGHSSRTSRNSTGCPSSFRC